MYKLLTLNQDIPKFGNVSLTPYPALKQQIFLIGTKIFIVQSNISLSHPLLSGFKRVSVSRFCHCHWHCKGCFFVSGAAALALSWSTYRPCSVLLGTNGPRKLKGGTRPRLSSTPFVPKLLHPGCCELALGELLSLRSPLGAPAL